MCDLHVCLYTYQDLLRYVPLHHTGSQWQHKLGRRIFLPRKPSADLINTVIKNLPCHLRPWSRNSSSPSSQAQLQGADLFLQGLDFLEKSLIGCLQARILFFNLLVRANRFIQLFSTELLDLFSEVLLGSAFRRAGRRTGAA